MPAPRSSSIPTRSTQTNATASRLFRPSTAGWYARWKARQAAAAEPAPAATPEPARQADPADALAKWLAGGAGPRA